MSGREGWIGVDLDATLARYDGWKGEEHIGEPIPRMIERVKAWIDDGVRVKIMTARVSGRDPEEVAAVKHSIREWLRRYGLPQDIEIVHEKDYAMLNLWDDRCVQVYANTGIAVEDEIEVLRDIAAFVKRGSRMAWPPEMLELIDKHSLMISDIERNARS